MLNISHNSVAENLKEYKIHSLGTLSTPRNGRVLARWLVSIIILLFFCMFLPWQQNVRGTGSVTAFTPAGRPQLVESAIPGRIVQWRVREGQFVHRGDTLLVLQEVKDDYFDPEIELRLDEQLAAKQENIKATGNQIVSTGRQIEALRQGLTYSLQKARNKVRQGRLKVFSDSADLVNETRQYDIAAAQYKRFEELFEQQGLISRTDLENRGAKLQQQRAKLVAQENKLLTSRNELLNALIELNSLEAEYSDKINKAEADRASKEAYLAEANKEYSALRNKAANVEVRRNNYYLLAPQDGFVVRALAAGLGETIKEGEAVVTIQPDNPDKAVELYMRAMDVPLIAIGRKVRIEFEGWPALQFSGWPSVSVGTFAGRVAVIDYVNSADGTYRILVTPDIENSQEWPQQLRLGSGAYGWVMLDDVPIWFEVWRQLNGFPPSLKRQVPPAISDPGKEKEKAKTEEGKEKPLKFKSSVNK